MNEPASQHSKFLQYSYSLASFSYHSPRALFSQHTDNNIMSRRSIANVDNALVEKMVANTVTIRIHILNAIGVVEYGGKTDC